MGQKYVPELTKKMRMTLRHRGPDSWGEWYDEGVWLAHQRLAILDLTQQGHQPMHSSCGRYVLVFNGEVYNYKDLRVDLEKVGYLFQGHSDSEVVLAACSVWGIEKAVKRFEGMFAFGLYDLHDHTLWLARDPMGIKPLYYAHLGGKLAFASELTPLRFLSWIDDSIDQDALYSYFRYLCVPSPLSILKGVKKLKSGSLLRFSGQSLTLQSYWDLVAQSKASRSRRETISLNEAADELEIRLGHSVRQHMQSDVPYGAFLSGGVDSSAIVALMQKASPSPIKTFSSGFSETSHDESVYARDVARYLCTDHHELILNADDIPDLVPKVGKLFDEPFADNSALPTYLVSQFARKHVTVCLSGDGGDELFGGYPRYFWGKRIEKFRKCMPSMGSKLASWMLQNCPNAFWDHIIDPISKYRFSSSEGLSFRVKRFGAYLGCPREEAYARTMSVWANPESLLGITPVAPHGADAAHYADMPWSEEMMLVDQQCYLQDDILTKVDRASMAVSMESRVPLLVHPIVEWSWQLDSKMKLAETGDCGKLVLRELLYRYVPRELIERPKQGFGMPVGKWLRGPLKEWAMSLLDPADLLDCGLRPEVVEAAWHEHEAGADRQAMIWAVLMYRQWYERKIT